MTRTSAQLSTNAATQRQDADALPPETVQLMTTTDPRHINWDGFALRPERDGRSSRVICPYTGTDPTSPKIAGARRSAASWRVTPTKNRVLYSCIRTTQQGYRTLLCLRASRSSTRATITNRSQVGMRRLMPPWSGGRAERISRGATVTTPAPTTREPASGARWALAAASVATTAPRHHPGSCAAEMVTGVVPSRGGQ